MKNFFNLLQMCTSIFETKSSWDPDMKFCRHFLYEFLPSLTREFSLVHLHVNTGWNIYKECMTVSILIQGCKLY